MDSHETPVLKLEVDKEDVWSALTGIDVNAPKPDNIQRVLKNLSEKINRMLDAQEEDQIKQVLASADSEMWSMHLNGPGADEALRVRDEIHRILNAR